MSLLELFRVVVCVRVCDAVPKSASSGSTKGLYQILALAKQLALGQHLAKQSKKKSH